MRIVLFTDVHYARGLIKCGTRTCYKSLEKLARIGAECGDADAFINLGDIVNDAGNAQANADNIREALAAVEKLPARCFSLAGNHDAEIADKRVFTGRETPWYSFELGGIEWLALDCNFRSDGSSYDDGAPVDWRDAFLPPAEMQWLYAKLHSEGLPLVVLAHQLVAGKKVAEHMAGNYAEVCALLAESERPVRAVMQGHYHAGCVSEQSGIPVYVFRAVCEGDDCHYAVLDVQDGAVSVEMRNIPGRRDTWTDAKANAGGIHI